MNVPAKPVYLKPAAVMTLATIPPRNRHWLKRRIDLLAEIPRTADAQPLDEQILRVRVREYRLMYRVLEDRIEVLAIRRGHCRRLKWAEEPAEAVRP